MNKEEIQKKLDDIESYHDIYDASQALRDAFNLGLEVAADEALADWTKIYTGIGEDIEVYVIKNSILQHKLK
jgi:hypothetical protein